MEEKVNSEKISTTGLIFEHSESPADYDKTIKVFEEGDVVTGSVVRIDRDEVLIDVGYKSEGVIPIKELDVRGNAKPDDVVHLGDEIDALVLQKEDKDGRLILSRKRAEYEKAWIRLDKMYQSKELISGTVIEVVKGGLILDVGLRGFLPASLVDMRRVKDLHQYLGQKLECRIIEMDRNRNNVVLSRRDALENEQHDKRVKVLKNLKPGDFVTGTISSIVNFGAFVDLGGIDGLIHISELSWDHVNDPHDIVEVGQEVKVKVLDIDFDKERVSLGLKQTQPDPWRAKADQFTKGSVSKGKIVKIVPFGVFVRLDDEVEGLVHVSEMSYQHIDNPATLYSEGDMVDIKVMDIDYDKHRIKLSIKATQPVPALPAETEEEGDQASPATEALLEPSTEENLPPSTEAELTASEPEQAETAASEDIEPSEALAEETEEASVDESESSEEETADEESAEYELIEEVESNEEAATTETAEESEETIEEESEEKIEEDTDESEDEVEEQAEEEAEEDVEEEEKQAETDDESPEKFELKESSEFEKESDKEYGSNASLESILEEMKKESGGE